MPFAKTNLMKQLSTFIAAFLTCCLLAFNAAAGTEMQPAGKEMKEVTPVPPPSCNWTGFYIGLHAGGEFGHSETKDLDAYWYPDRPWGYSESSFIGGGQAGYNLQMGQFVIGPEFDVGYMNVDGHGQEPGTNYEGGPNFGASSSGFYTTLRGRLGVSFDWYGCWLVYGTGGAIGVNYETKDYDPNENFYGSRTDFKWGYTVGGGVERKIASQWSIKVEYLYFDLGNQGFTGSSPTYEPGTDFHFHGDTAGHIVRAGVNFHF
jgi:outer membrane immunogenic protein